MPEWAQFAAGWHWSSAYPSPMPEHCRVSSSPGCFLTSKGMCRQGTMQAAACRAGVHLGFTLGLCCSSLRASSAWKGGCSW